MNRTPSRAKAIAASLVVLSPAPSYMASVPAALLRPGRNDADQIVEHLAALGMDARPSFEALEAERVRRGLRSGVTVAEGASSRDALPMFEVSEPMPSEDGAGNVARLRALLSPSTPGEVEHLGRIILTEERDEFEDAA